MEFLGVRIDTECPQGELVTVQGGLAAFAPLSIAGKPNMITLNISAPAQEGIVPFVVHGAWPTSLGKAFSLDVPVQWRGSVPSTRQKGKDNVDVILLDTATGHFVDIQVGLVTRNGKFFLTVQEIWQGWIAGTTENPQFVPSRPEHAYPGSDYAGIWQGMSNVIGSLWDAAKNGPRPARTPAEWNPPVLTGQVKPGWKTGIDLYSNMITGTSMVLGDDGGRYFVHFSTIEGEDPVKTLTPMTAVEFKLNLPLRREEKPAVVLCRQRS